MLARELAAAIGIERVHRILFDIGRALAPVEHIIRRDMNQRNSAAAGLGRKPRRRLGIDGERSRFFAFGAVDIGIGGCVDDGAPGLGRDDPRDRLRILQIELTACRRDEHDFIGTRERAKLRADLAGAAEKEEAHPSRALLRQPAAGGGVVRGQERLPPGAVLDVPFHGRAQAVLEGVLAATSRAPR